MAGKNKAKDYYDDDDFEKFAILQAKEKSGNVFMFKYQLWVYQKN